MTEIIEFADPGLDFTYAFIVGAIIVAGVILTAIGLSIPKKHFKDWMPLPGLIVAVLGLALSLGIAPVLSTAYDNAVRDEKVSALEAAGFQYVSLRGDEFNANKGGEFFRGILVDIHPDKDYAYQIVEVPKEY